MTRCHTVYHALTESHEFWYLNWQVGLMFKICVANKMAGVWKAINDSKIHCAAKYLKVASVFNIYRLLLTHLGEEFSVSHFQFYTERRKILILWLESCRLKCDSSSPSRDDSKNFGKWMNKTWINKDWIVSRHIQYKYVNILVYVIIS